MFTNSNVDRYLQYEPAAERVREIELSAEQRAEHVVLERLAELPPDHECDTAWVAGAVREVLRRDDLDANTVAEAIDLAERNSWSLRQTAWVLLEDDDLVETFAGLVAIDLGYEPSLGRRVLRTGEAIRELLDAVTDIIEAFLRVREDAKETRHKQAQRAVLVDALEAARSGPPPQPIRERWFNNVKTSWRENLSASLVVAAVLVIPMALVFLLVRFFAWAPPVVYRAFIYIGWIALGIGVLWAVSRAFLDRR